MDRILVPSFKLKEKSDFEVPDRKIREDELVNLMYDILRTDHYYLPVKEGVKLMHYRNGREAKNGDKVVQLSMDGAKIVSVGILHDATPGNDYCNGGIAPMTVAGVSGACLCDCIHVDDLVEILKEKGLDKRPSRK